jgi:hypothetical protein
MNTSLHIGNISGSLAAMLCVCGLVACTTQEASPGTGGSGAGGSAAGGATTPAGSGGASGGTTGASSGSDGTLCPAPQQIITDFTYLLSDAGTASTTEVRFGGSGALQGGESSFPASLKSDVTQSNWHLSGTVSDYSGFALYFDNCDHLDASKYKGISFTISGSVPHGNAITFGMGTLNDTPSAAWLLANGKTTAKATDAGRCTPSSNTNNQYYHPGCGDPTVQIPVTAAPVTQTVLWGSLTGGTPDSSIKPGEITSIYWNIPWTGSSDTSYPVDLVVDDLALIP